MLHDNCIDTKKPTNTEPDAILDPDSGVFEEQNWLRILLSCSSPGD